MKKRLNIILLTILVLVGVSLPAGASYMPFNTNVNMNVGIGTSTPQGALVVMNGNVGIGTWIPAAPLETNINGIAATSTDAWVLSNYTASTVGTPFQYSPRIRFHGNEFNGGNHTIDFKIEEQEQVNQGNLVFATSTDGAAYNNNLYLDNFGGVTIVGSFLSSNRMTAESNFSGNVALTVLGAPNQTADLLDWENSGGTIVDEVTASGNVGIGTLSSNNQLVVNGAVGIGTANSSYVTTIAPAGGMIVQGNVGIGSLTPGQILDVHGTVRMTGLTLTGNGAANGNVLVGNAVGVGTWMPASTLVAGGGTNYWLNDVGNVGISTTYAVGIGTTFVGGTGEASFSVMNGNVGIGTWVPGSLLDVGNAATGDVQIGNGNVTVSNELGIAAFGDGIFFAGSNGFGTITGSASTNPFYLSLGTDTNPNLLNLSLNNVGVGSISPGQMLDVQGTVRMTGLTLAGNGAANGNVLVTNGVGVGTWMSASTLVAGGGSNYWLKNVGANVGISTTYAVGIGTTFVGGTGEASFSVMNGNVGIGTWLPAAPLSVKGTVPGTFGVGPNDVVTSVFTAAPGIGTTWLILNNTGGVDASDAYGFAQNGTIKWSFGSDLLANGGQNFYIFDEVAAKARLYIDNNGNIGIGTAATPAGGMVVMNGNVGIGSVTPGQALDVNGTVRMTGLTLTGNGAANGNVLVGNSVGVGTWMAASTLSGASSSNYWLNDTGNVGINTTYNIGIGTIAAVNTLNILGNIGIGTFSFDPYMRTAAPSGGMIISGNVGIGTWVPGGALNVTNGVVLIGTSSDFTDTFAPHQLVVSGPDNSNVMAITNTTKTQKFAFYIQNGFPVPVQMGSISNANYGIFTNNASPQFVLDTNGGATVGGGYYTLTAPANGLLVQGNVGIGTFNALGGGLIILPANTGNVGIGSLTPGQALDVNGTVRTMGLTLTGNGAANGNVLVTNGVGVGTWMPASTLVTGGSSNYWLKNAGANVGISTTYAVGIGTTFIGGPGEAALSIMNGNVGIGTWVPGDSLVIARNTSNPVAGLIISNSNNAGASGDIFYNDTNVILDSAVYGSNYSIPGLRNFAEMGSAFGDAGFEIATNANLTSGGSSPIILSPGGYANERMRITAGGNVGIGSANPGQALDIQGTVRTIGLTMSGQTPISGYVLTASDGAGDTTWTAPGVAGGWTVSGNNVYETSSGNVGIGTTVVSGAGVGALSVMNGNVGIGTWLPGSILFVNGGTITSYNAIAANGEGILSYAGNGKAIAVQAGTANGNILYDSTGGLSFQSEPRAQVLAGTSSSANITMFIDANGNVGIGTNAFVTGGLAVMNGNVGVGSLHPGQALDVQGTLRDLGVLVNGNVGIGTSFVNGAGEAALTVMNGNVGIGTWLPGNLLQINGPMPNSSTNLFSVTDSLAPGGYLAIGNSTNAINEYQPQITGVSAGYNGNALIFLGLLPAAQDALNGSDGVIDFQAARSDGSAIQTTPLFSFLNSLGGAVMLIDKSGNVGIGTGNPFGGKLIIPSGNVGIGSLAPGQLLDVQGTARMTGFTLTGNGAAPGNVMVSNTIGVGTWMPTTTLPVGTLIAGTTNQVAYYSAATTLASNADMVFNGANVGIGTSIPGGGLAVMNGNVGIGTWLPGGSLVVKSGNVGIGSDNTPDGTLEVTQVSGVPPFQVSSTSTTNGDYLSVINGGNVGIGTATPQGRLVVMNGNVGIGTLAPTAQLQVGDSAVVGSTSQAAVGGNFAAGGFASAIGSNSIALGGSLLSGGSASAAIGFNGESYGLGSVALGSDVAAYGDGSAAIGQNVTVGVAFGQGNGFGNYSVGIGLGTTAGTEPTITGTGSLGIFMGDQSNVVISGSHIMSILGGNVGIGTTTPQASFVSMGSVGIGTWTAHSGVGLTVMNGSVGIGTVGGNAALEIAYSSATGDAIHFTNTRPNGRSWAIGDSVNSPPGPGNFEITDLTTNTDRIVLNSSGNVGIGSLVPGQILDVQGTVRDLGELVNGNVGIGTSFVNGSGEGALTVMNGNVGIGTWVPAYSLDLVNGTARQRNIRRVNTEASGTVTINTDTTDLYTVTALAAAITFNNPTGTPNNGDLLEIRILDNGTARAITWGTNFASTATTLPTTTVVSTTMRVLLEYDSAQTKWECIGVT